MLTLHAVGLKYTVKYHNSLHEQNDRKHQKTSRFMCKNHHSRYLKILPDDDMDGLCSDLFVLFFVFIVLDRPTSKVTCSSLLAGKGAFSVNTRCLIHFMVPCFAAKFIK